MKRAESSSSLYSIAPDAPCNESFTVGDLVKKGDLHGKVAFVGQTEFEKGQWIGIILERPEGKNNGTVKGKTYFKCPEKYGLFCRPNALTKLRGGDSSNNNHRGGGKRFGSPTPSYAGSMAPSIAASQMGKEHSMYSAEYGYDLGQNVATADGRVGKVKFLDRLNDGGQVYVGILFSKPVGDSDGKFQGIKHFTSYPKFATFLPADQVKLATTTSAALPPKTAPRETKASLLRKEKRADGGGTIYSSWRGSQESLNSQRSPRSPPPKTGTGLKRQPNPMKDNEMIAGLKKDLQEKEAHLAKMSNEMEERRAESDNVIEILRNENRSLKLNVGEMTAKIGKLEEQLTKSQNKCEELQDHFEDLREKYDERSFLCTEMEIKLDEMREKEQQQQHYLEPLIEVVEEEQNSSGNDEAKICSEMATQTEKHGNSNAECQTIAEEKVPAKICLEMATQTAEKHGNSNAECQTISEEKRVYSNAECQTNAEEKRVHSNAECQTNAEEKAKICSEMATQTEKHGNSNAECQTIAEEKRVYSNAECQTIAEEKRVYSNAECQTIAEEKRVYSNAECQTNAEEKVPAKICLEMTTQTEKYGNSNAECQTNAEEQKVQIEVNVQTDETAPINLADVGIQTEMLPTTAADQNERQPNSMKDNEMIAGLKKNLQEKEAHLAKMSNEMEERRAESDNIIEILRKENRSLKLNVDEMTTKLEENTTRIKELLNARADVAVQTETTNAADQNNIQIGTTTANRKQQQQQKEYSSSPSNKGSGGGVLELNVMTLPMDAEHLPSGQNSPNTWQRKYEEKCQTTQFLNSIIADQEKKIEELRRLNAEFNGNGNSSSTKKATPPPPPPKTRSMPSRRRMYCEHCEQFDVHETDDCPKLEALAAEAMEHSAYSPKKQREY